MEDGITRGEIIIQGILHSNCHPCKEKTIWNARHIYKNVPYSKYSSSIWWNSQAGVSRTWIGWHIAIRTNQKLSKSVFRLLRTLKNRFSNTLANPVMFLWFSLVNNSSLFPCPWSTQASDRRWLVEDFKSLCCDMWMVGLICELSSVTTGLKLRVRYLLVPNFDWWKKYINFDGILLWKPRTH